MKYLVYRDSKRQYRWTLYGDNGEALAVSSEGYKRKRDCLWAIDLVKASGDAVVIAR